MLEPDAPAKAAASRRTPNGASPRFYGVRELAPAFYSQTGLAVARSRRGTACCARCNAADRRYPLADTRSIPASAAPLPLIARSTQQFVPQKGHFSVTPTRFCPKSRSHTKHTTKPPLPGSRFAHRNAPTSLAKPLSNRELHLLEPALTHRKQKTAPRSNRELSTNPCRANSYFPTEFFANSAVCLTFLTGSASQTEIAVTPSKQTLATFLTGSRIAHMRFAAWQVQP